MGKLEDQDTERLAAELMRDRRIDAAWMHGSALGPRFGSWSDVDVAILPPPGVRLGMADLLDISVALQAHIGAQIDVGMMSLANTVYAKEVVEHGVCLVCRDVFRRDMFVASALSLYAQLRFERSEVEHAYAA